MQHDGHVCRTRKRIIDGKRSYKLIIANLEREQLKNILVNSTSKISVTYKILMIAHYEIIRYGGEKEMKCLNNKFKND